jgi:hypothetical protein
VIAKAVKLTRSILAADGESITSAMKRLRAATQL